MKVFDYKIKQNDKKTNISVNHFKKDWIRAVKTCDIVLEKKFHVEKHFKGTWIN